MRPGLIAQRNRRLELLRQIEAAKTPEEILSAVIKLRRFRGQFRIWSRGKY